MFIRIVFVVFCIAPATLNVSAETLSTVAPLQARGHSFSAKATINGTVKADLLIDTGSSFTIITRKFAKKLGLQNIDRAPRYPVSTPAGILWGKLAILASVKVGGAKIANVTAIIFPESAKGTDGALGASFLNNFVYTVDGPGAKLTLKIPDEGSPLYGGRSARWWNARIDKCEENIHRFRGYGKALAGSLKSGGRRGGKKFTDEDLKGIAGFYEQLLSKLKADARSHKAPF